MKRLATALTVLVLTASIGPSTVAASIAPITAGQASGQTFGQQASGQASSEAYAGTHVSFDTADRAVTDYAVHGETMLNSVKVESQQSVESGGLVDVGASLSAVTKLDGAGLNVGATTQTEARVRAENGATIAAHDNDRGILVVASGNQSDYVVADLSSGAEASAESDSQVEVTTENGTEGTFIVVGEGNVTVNDEGDVTAHLGEEGRLAFRAYPDGKDDDDQSQEKLIAQGEAKAEAYVMTASESGNETGDASDGEDANETGDESEEVVVDTVSYGQNTTVEAKETADGTVTLAVNRTTHEGTILVTSVSEEALNATEGLTVTVDGEAAAEARTYTQLQSAIGSDQSRYLVRSSGSSSAEASASADVLVAVNHFSERAVSFSEAASDETTTGTTTGGEATTSETTDGSDETTADGDETTESGTADQPPAENDDSETGGSGSIPGFTATAAVVALVGGALLARGR